ncbi:MAG: hypothetical protein U0822_19675 [Anaerolineae bacterium]
MASTRLAAIIQQAQELSPDEQLDLIAYLAQKAREGYQARRRCHWSEIRGLAPYPLVGEDAQEWVARTRRESDEDR